MYNFIKEFESTIKNNGELTAITEIQGYNETYRELAWKIYCFHSFWEKIGLNKGDKIAIAANNSAAWVELFMAIETGGYIAVLLQPNTSSQEVYRLTNHSESKLLYCEDNFAISNGGCTFEGLYACIRLSSQELIWCSNSSSSLDTKIGSMFPAIPLSFDTQSVHYDNINLDDVCTVIYTSGTTGFPKASMVSYAYWGINAEKFFSRYSHILGGNTVSVAPFYHIFGLGVDLLVTMCSGMNLVVNKNVTPETLLYAFRHYKPKMIIAVPVLLHKMLEAILGGKTLDNDLISYYSSLNESELYELKNKLLTAFGGDLTVFLSGGAPLARVEEQFIVEKLHFPLVSNYGLTETGPVSYGIVGEYIVGSAGKVVSENKIRIDSIKPESVAGEIQVKDNIFSGYFKNPNATASAFTSDGWFRTGDLGIIDSSGNLFITGRCKDMLQTSNGENIYPEDIEAVMNASPYIKESILVQRGEKLYAIVVPDREKADADQIDSDALNKKIDEAAREASKKIPGFTIISSFELRDEPLERTPKGSLKRFLYSDGIKES